MGLLLGRFGVLSVALISRDLVTPCNDDVMVL
jgi:hypothetical protein